VSPSDVSNYETLEAVLETVLTAMQACVNAIEQMQQQTNAIVEENRRLQERNDNLAVALSESRERLNRLLDSNRVVIAPSQDTLSVSRVDQDVRTIFSTRTGNLLYREGVKTLSELIGLSDEEILHIRQAGVATLKEIRQTITVQG
jgi:DNA-directed RNA polymerase alpha subunit